MGLSLSPSGSIVFYSTVASQSILTSGAGSGSAIIIHNREPQDEAVRIGTDYENGYPKGFQFLIRSESAGTSNPISALYITTSRKDLKVGFGTDDPVSSLDVRSVTSSAPANIILRTNEDGVITPGEETGRIIFAIESASFRGTKVVTSGSVGDIFGEVIGVGSTGAYGKLMFSVNDSTGQNPKSVLQLGYGAGSGLPEYEVFISASDLLHDDDAPQYVQKTDGTTIAILGRRDATNNKNVGKLTIHSASVERLLIDGLDGSISASGDISIKGFTSVSASLAAAGGGGGSTPTLQQVMDQGSSTTTPITASIISASDTITSVSASIDRVLVNDTLQGNGAGFQFFAFNEDTVKVKFANWYTANDNQYGMGMLWYETWFAAIDLDGHANDVHRRIGFYLETPNSGSTDSTSGVTGTHPTNARFYVDITGSYVASGGLHVTDANFNVESNGNVEVNGDITASGKIVDSTYPTDNLLNLHDDNVVNANGVTLSSIGSTVFMIDSNNSGTSDKFEFRTDSRDASAGTLLATIEDNGDLDVEGAITSQGDPVISQSGEFVNNEFIVAAGKYAVTSSDALAVDSAGNLGIGTPNPEVRLHMLGEAPQTTQILMEQFNDTADAPDIRTRRYRGTSASRADVQTGDYLFRLNVHGQDDGASELYGSMQFDVDSSDQDALNWRLQTRDTTGTNATRLTIDENGNFTASGEFSATIKGGTF